ncbi:hypothetical protein LRP49_08140 [Enterovibrio sp. ZSDZ35]|uniref:Uncharacterized protein n=1 Tax=Enterovibrio qingdaonensis TaxID=2899818 RepID=A0ABT5QJY9_9GAMM|nr:hypothetical protein [Enterovibrio sp. ZSDZ35]MDD1781174.1 hypothetical protein [Enterovibrio sp. ZSDZ35]
MRQALKVIGITLGILYLLFAVFVIWSRISIEEAQKKAIPFVTESMPLIGNWNFDEFAFLLTPGALDTFRSERGQKITAYMSKIGELKAFNEPEVLNVSSSTEDIDTVTLKVDAEFENGLGTVMIVLIETESGYLIHRIHLNTDFFLLPTD